MVSGSPISIVDFLVGAAALEGPVTYFDWAAAAEGPVTHDSRDFT